MSDFTDLEATNICAVALGFRPVGEYKDFETTKAIQMEEVLGGPKYKYSPLTDGASAFELVEVFQLAIDRFAMMKAGEIPTWGWRVKGGDTSYVHFSLKKAITICVAKMKQ